MYPDVLVLKLQNNKQSWSCYWGLIPNYGKVPGKQVIISKFSFGHVFSFLDETYNHVKRGNFLGKVQKTQTCKWS